MEDRIYFIVSIVIFSFLRIFIFLAIFVAIYIAIKCLWRYKKYGMHEFRDFKKKNPVDITLELARLALLKEHESDQLIENPNLNSNFLLIDEYGLSLFMIFALEGKIEGSETDDVWKVYFSRRKFRKIKNPLLFLDEDEKKLRAILTENVVIKKYLLLNNMTILLNTYSNNYEVLKSKELYYFLDKRKSKATKVLSESEIKKISAKLNQTIVDNSINK